GMPKSRSQWGLYYYYHTMAKTLQTLEFDEFTDAQGNKHDWRADITGALAKRQRPDGSWLNINHWMEADPNLVTGYSLIALSYSRPKNGWTTRPPKATNLTLLDVGEERW